MELIRKKMMIQNQVTLMMSKKIIRPRVVLLHQRKILKYLHNCHQGSHNSRQTVSLADAAKTILSVEVSNDDGRSTYVLVIEKELDTAGETDDEAAEVDSTNQTEASVSAADVKGEQGAKRINMVESNHLTNESSSTWSRMKNFFASLFN